MMMLYEKLSALFPASLLMLTRRAFRLVTVISNLFHECLNQSRRDMGSETSVYEFSGLFRSFLMALALDHFPITNIAVTNIVPAIRIVRADPANSSVKFILLRGVMVSELLFSWCLAPVFERLLTRRA